MDARTKWPQWQKWAQEHGLALSKVDGNTDASRCPICQQQRPILSPRVIVTAHKVVVDEERGGKPLSTEARAAWPGSCWRLSAPSGSASAAEPPHPSHGLWEPPAPGD